MKSIRIPLGLFGRANKRKLVVPLLFYFKLVTHTEGNEIFKFDFLGKYSKILGMTKPNLVKNMAKIKFFLKEDGDFYILNTPEEVFETVGILKEFEDSYFDLPVLGDNRELQTIWMYLELYHYFRLQGWDELRETENLIEVAGGTISQDILGYESDRTGVKLKSLFQELGAIKITQNNLGADKISFLLHPRAIKEAIDLLPKNPELKEIIEEGKKLNISPLEELEELTLNFNKVKGFPIKVVEGPSTAPETSTTPENGEGEGRGDSEGEGVGENGRDTEGRKVSQKIKTKGVKEILKEVPKKKEESIFGELDSS